MSAEKIVENSRAAAFSRGADGTITAWNRAAEELFAVPKKSAVGCKCHEVIRGRDAFGNDYCGPECASWRMASVDRPVRPYRLTVTIDNGWEIDVLVSVVTAEGPTGRELVHMLESVTGRGVYWRLSEGPDCDDGWNRTSAALTRRELQVLRQLAAGRSTEDIVAELEISRATVRNHISRCLKKLEVHSRIEAVGLARRLDLV